MVVAVVVVVEGQNGEGSVVRTTVPRVPGHAFGAGGGGGGGGGRAERRGG